MSATTNRFGDVAEDGSYSDPIAGDGRRFFTMIGTLIRGRISVAGTAGSATKRALAIAVGYGNIRRQFERPDGQGEVVLLDYRAHQRALLPALAATYALSFAQHDLVAALAAQSEATQDHPDERHQRELESRQRRQGGGHRARDRDDPGVPPGLRRRGYLAENRLTTLKADTDVFTTFEGDNTVLLQLVAKGLLTELSRATSPISTRWPRRASSAEQAAARSSSGPRRAAVLQRLLAVGPNPTMRRHLRPGLAGADIFEWPGGTCSDGSPSGCAGGARTPPTRSRCSTTRRTICWPPPGAHRTTSCWRRSSAAVERCPTRP